MKQPPLITSSQVDVLPAGKTTLENGVALYTLAADEFEVLRVTFVFRAGSLVQSVPFSASATANLLAEGTRNLTAHEIAERLDFYGSYFDVNLDRDYAYISFCMLSKFVGPTLAVAEEILLRPVFPEEEIATYREKRKQRLQIERTKVETEAREAFARALFGERHPYGVTYDEQEYDTLKRDDLVAFYRRFYTAGNCFVVCSGRIGECERQAVAALARQLPEGEACRVGEEFAGKDCDPTADKTAARREASAAGGAAVGMSESAGECKATACEASTERAQNAGACKATTGEPDGRRATANEADGNAAPVATPFRCSCPVTLPAPETTHEAFVPHPGAVQSSLRLGRLLFGRQHPDFVGMQVVATVLGGYFGSRLMQNLRERHGYTYGVVAAMVNFEQAGYLAVATQVGTEATPAALREIYAEIERLRTQTMPDEELALVKNIMIGEMMRILDGPFGIADVTIENLLCGTDNTAIDENIRRIRSMTPADVRRLAEKYLAREELVTVVAGEVEQG